MDSCPLRAGLTQLGPLGWRELWAPGHQHSVQCSAKMLILVFCYIFFASISVLLLILLLMWSFSPLSIFLFVFCLPRKVPSNFEGGSRATSKCLFQFSLNILSVKLNMLITSYCSSLLIMWSSSKTMRFSFLMFLLLWTQCSFFLVWCLCAVYVAFICTSPKAKCRFTFKIKRKKTCSCCCFGKVSLFNK